MVFPYSMDPMMVFPYPIDPMMVFPYPMDPMMVFPYPMDPMMVFPYPMDPMMVFPYPMAISLTSGLLSSPPALQSILSSCSSVLLFWLVPSFVFVCRHDEIVPDKTVCSC